MNKFKILLPTIITIIGVSVLPRQSYAQPSSLVWEPGPVKDAGGQVARRLFADGSIEDGSALKVGQMDHQGNVYDAGGMLLAILHPDHKVTDREGMLLGYSDPHGVIHGYRKILGYYKPDGRLVDSQGNLLERFPKGDGDIALLYVLGVLP